MAQEGLTLHEEVRKMMWVASIRVHTGKWLISKPYESLNELGKHVDEYIAEHENAMVNIYRRTSFE